MVDLEMAGSPMRGVGCPWIDSTLDRYAKRSTAEGLALVTRWTGVSADGLDASALRQLIVDRARQGVRVWRNGERPPLDPAMEGLAVPVQPFRPDATDGAHLPVDALGALGAGAPLDGAIRATMEADLGGDFQQVRVHTGAAAGALARRLDATAFTVGADVVFAPGAYRPGTPYGDRLIAHELAHVRQQRAAGPAGDPRALERDADQAAAMRRPPARSAGGLRLQRCKSDPNMGVEWDGPRLSQDEIPKKQLEYEVAIALVDAQVIDLQDQHAEQSTLDEARDAAQALRMSRDTLAQAIPHLSEGEDLVWFRSTVFPWAGWLPLQYAVRQQEAESDRFFQSGVRMAQRYLILVDRWGWSPEKAVAGLALLTAGEFVGVTQLVEAIKGRELVTERELSTAERILRGATGVIAVASLTVGSMSGPGGPRVSGWASGLGKGTQVRWLAPAGARGPLPVILVADGAAPLALSRAEIASLQQAGLLNLAMMSAGGDGPSPPAGSSGGGSSERPPAREEGTPPPEPAWTPPKSWNGPAKHGSWSGERGNSGWIDERPEVIRVVGKGADSRANPIPFRRGEVDFSRWSQGELRVSGLTGEHANDMKLIRRAIADREGLAIGKSNSAREAAALDWLREASDGHGGKGLRPHHAGGDRIQLVPKDVHKVQHTDVSVY